MQLNLLRGLILVIINDKVDDVYIYIYIYIYVIKIYTIMPPTTPLGTGVSAQYFKMDFFVNTLQPINEKSTLAQVIAGVF